MAKYDPLEMHLNQLREQKRYEWNTNFKHVENTLGFVLPASARKYPEWWANESLSYTTKSQCRAWGSAQWKTAHVNISNETLSFFATRNTTSPSPTKPTHVETLAVAFHWDRKGYVQFDHKGRLKFPVLLPEASVYKLSIQFNDMTNIYIGETDNLRRRAQGYRTPGITQATNKRIRAIIETALKSDGTAEISILNIASSNNIYNLDNRFIRRLFENAAIISYIGRDETILNL